MSPKTVHERSSASPSSSKNSSSSSKSKQVRSDEWSDVNDPEQRRRIQNRIAQRRFRERARDEREQSERDSRNMRHAELQYRTADPDELGFEDAEQLDGLPWGGPSMRYIVARGVAHERSRDDGGHGSSSRYHHRHSSGDNRGGSSRRSSDYYVNDDNFYDHDDGETVVAAADTGSGSDSYQQYFNVGSYGQGIMARRGFDDGFVSAFDQSIPDYGTIGHYDAFTGDQNSYGYNDGTDITGLGSFETFP